MKKKITLALVLALAVFALAACGGTTPPADDNGGEAAALKTGLAIATGIGHSVDAGEEDGNAQADSTIVAVTVDEDGIIQKCAIDVIETKIAISADGKITTPLDTVFVGKQEIGDGYGMKKASGIGKEWYEQANALAAYAVGKSVAELKAIAVTESGAPADTDLSATVTLKIGGFIDAIEQAVASAKSLGAQAGNRIGIGVYSTIDMSEDAGDSNGTAQAYVNAAAVTFDKDGVVTSCIIDAAQADIEFTTAGAIATDLEATFVSKNVLGDAYGMKKASSIGKEWYEQAAGFAAYATGKTAAEVKGIALTDDGLAADADLASTATIHIGPFMTNVEKAYQAVK